MAAMAAVLLCAALVDGAAPRLRFRSDGRFRILQVADMHFVDGAETRCVDVLPSQKASCSDLNTTAFLERMIAAERPDLVVFTGDNIFASESTNPAASLEAAFQPVVQARIPWAAVLGNHDQECSLGRGGVMSYIAEMDYTLSRVFPEDDAASTVDGFGNYNLEVLGAEDSDLQSKSVLNLYFVDSGDYSRDAAVSGYGWVEPSQQAWMRGISSSLQAAYMDPPFAQPEPAPALAFFHIPLPEVSNLTDFLGVKQEDINSARYNSGFFSTLVGTGDVCAAFVGHDHLNDFCGKLETVNLCYGGGFGYHAYGAAGWPRRARVVEARLEEDAHGRWVGVREVSTWKRLDNPELSHSDHLILWVN